MLRIFGIIPSLFIFNKYFHLCLIDWNEISTSKPKNTSMLKTRSENTNRTSTSILKQQLGLIPSPSNNNSNVGSSISQLHLSGPQTGNFNINKPINSFCTWKCGNNYYSEIFLILLEFDMEVLDMIPPPPSILGANTWEEAASDFNNGHELCLNDQDFSSMKSIVEQAFKDGRDVLDIISAV